MKKGTGKKVKFSTDTVEDKTPRMDQETGIKDSVLRELLGSGYVKVVRRAPSRRNWFCDVFRFQLNKEVYSFTVLQLYLYSSCYYISE